MGNYFNAAVPLKNFILMGTDMNDLKHKAEDIVKEAVRLSPDSFCGNNPVFPFELRYTPPFEKSFAELKRLQGTAADNAGYRSGYRGYILIDINGFLKHEAEAYLDIALKFLYDSNDNWKYIFLIDSSRSKVAGELIRTILGFLRCKVVDCNENRENAENNFIRSVAAEYGLKCTRNLQSFLAYAVVRESISRGVAETVLYDMAQSGCSESASLKTLYDYLAGDSPTVKYMLSDERLEELTVLCGKERQKENNSEKI